MQIVLTLLIGLALVGVLYAQKPSRPVRVPVRVRSQKRSQGK